MGGFVNMTSEARKQREDTSRRWLLGLTVLSGVILSLISMGLMLTRG